MATSTRFDNWKRPAANQALSEIEVEGVRLDLHDKLRLVGLTFGIEPTTATLGWAAAGEVLRVRNGQAVAISGVALHCVELNRFEVSFKNESPGQLEYFELRHDPELTLIFFFEGGTVRLSGALFRAELITDSDDDPLPTLIQ
jgi:hypothetical protein